MAQARQLDCQGTPDNDQGSNANDLVSSGYDVSCSDPGDLKTADGLELLPIEENALDTSVALPRNDQLVRDNRHCLAFLPEEVWVLISDLLDSTSLENFCNASLFFRSLLLSKRVVRLFPHVWNLLALEYHESQDIPTEASRQCSSCGKLGKTNWYSEILKLRLVCKKWSTVIDSFYRNLPRQFNIAPQDSENLFIATSPWTENLFLQADTKQNYRHFLQHFQISHGSSIRNPFLYGNCAIELNDIIGRNENPFPELLSLFEKYGHHIWHCTIKITNTLDTLAEWYAKVRVLLENLPNLRSLGLIYKFESRDFNRLAFDMPQLIQAINMSPLPTLENLEGLVTESLPTLVFKEITRRNNHVTMLDITGMTSHNSCTTFTLPFANLRELKMEVLSEVELHSLANCSETWIMEKVSLDFGRFTPTSVDYCLEWPRVFIMLESKWATSLIEVSLSLPDRPKRDREEFLRECGFYRLNLPNVKRCQLFLNIETSLDFILPMRNSLEFLDVTTKYGIPRATKSFLSLRKGQVIQFHGYEDRMLGSNIWRIFPKLQRLCFFNADWDEDYEKVAFTRPQWEQEVKVNNYCPSGNEAEGMKDVATQTDGM